MKSKLAYAHKSTQPIDVNAQFNKDLQSLKPCWQVHVSHSDQYQGFDLKDLVPFCDELQYIKCKCRTQLQLHTLVQQQGSTKSYCQRCKFEKKCELLLLKQNNKDDMTQCKVCLFSKL